MWRFAIIFLLVIGLAPLVPMWLESRLDPGGTNAAHVSEAGTATGAERRYTISANRSGQFVAEVEVNGRFLEMLVDTGASATALPVSIAEEAGIFLQNKDFKYRVGTANGTTYGARAMIDRLKIGQISLRDIETIVLRDDSLSTPLLGMTALNKLDRFDISNGTLVLVQ